MPEDPRSALLEEMLTVVPYKAPDSKEKKKKSDVREAREGLRSRAHPDTRSGETQVPSALKGEQKEAEESDSSRTRRGRLQNTPRRSNLLMPRKSSAGPSWSCLQTARIPMRNP